MKKWIWLLPLAFAIGLGAQYWLNDSTEKDSISATLASANNANIELFNPNDSRVRIIYFGFTRCPDVCPTSLAMLSGALKQLEPQELAQIRPIFISLDPDRDDAALAHQYAQYFHPAIEGMSGSLEVTQQLAQRYGVIFQKTELEGSELDYTLDHNSYFYFIDAQGQLVTKVPHALSPAPVLAAIKTMTTP
ncbi:SCO family protein [Vibrio astriarenae]|uniref:SCO family protein n=1 Tax=Vibrio astriarenae TaxID=1481923 RepID=UPI0037356321